MNKKSIKLVAIGVLISLLTFIGVGCTPEQQAAWDALAPHQQTAILASYSAPTGGPSASQWAALRKCESSGNYGAVSASGKYRGAYQFDYGTWDNYGPAGDPAAASPAEQDARAKALYADRGHRPWPKCGRFIR